jgi:hypothetical protein
MQRTLFVGETAQISLLGPPVEPLIERGYIDYFGGREFPWEEIDGAATAFFDAHPNDPDSIGFGIALLGISYAVCALIPGFFIPEKMFDPSAIETHVSGDAVNA